MTRDELQEFLTARSRHAAAVDAMTAAIRSKERSEAVLSALLDEVEDAGKAFDEVIDRLGPTTD